MYTDNVLGTACAWNGATFFCHGTARQSVYTCVKADTARVIGVPRPTYLVVLGTVKNLGTGAEPAPFTLSEFSVPKY